MANKLSPIPVSLLTLQETADFCRVSSRTITRWIDAGDLPAIKLGALWRINRIDLDQFLLARWTGASRLSSGVNQCRDLEHHRAKVTK